MATQEAKSSLVVRLRATAWGLKLFRNNSGVLFNQENVPVRFGLGNESAKINKQLKTGDFIGWTPVVITQAMVGKTIAVFTNIEAKAAGFKHRETYNKNSREHAQDSFNNLVNNAGGVAGFASCDSDVDRIINSYHIRMNHND